jgi:hypothetical protein
MRRLPLRQLGCLQRWWWQTEAVNTLAHETRPLIDMRIAAPRKTALRADFRCGNGGHPMRRVYCVFNLVQQRVYAFRKLSTARRFISARVAQGTSPTAFVGPQRVLVR